MGEILVRLSFTKQVTKLDIFYLILFFYFGTIFTAFLRVIDRKYEPFIGIPDENVLIKPHEHYHSFLYLAILSELLGQPILAMFGLPLLIDEAYLHRPHEFAWGYDWFWYSTIWGIVLTLIWILAGVFS